MFGLFIGLTFYFALVSPNLTLGDTVTKQTIGDQTTWVTIVFLLILIIGGLVSVVNPTLQVWLKKVFINKGYLTGSILLAGAFGVQILVIVNTHPAIGFDPGALHDALINPKQSDLQSYFSYNTNNLPLLLVQHALSLLVNSHSWLVFDLINSALLGITVALNLLAVYIINSQCLKAALYLHAAWLMVFPMVLVPYSDIAVLPLVSALIVLYALTNKLKNQLLLGGLAIGMGVIGASIYFIKPSAIIPIIALYILEIIMLNRKNFIKTGLLLGIIGISLATTYTYVQQGLNQQNYIKIEKKRTIPAIHFISMGVSGDGGYNAKDALAMAKQPSQAKMRAYSKQKLIARLQKKGFWGYLRFLLHKQNKNSADGTFAWLIEGNFMDVHPTGSGLKRLIQEFYYPQGKHLADFRYIAQVWWIAILGVIVLGWQQKNKFTMVMRLAIIGGFVYLLIFEGGRSRYLIQFLPMFLVLASLCWVTSINLIKEKFAWLKDNN
ncbi:hypothetical protein EFS54_06645 [Periweissella beninensis]|uniref:Glycosyltransferase RgtA/B/C/D-like domain-containing protein n=2 Tax=Periweissella beninensis TaxID=504936 RepID=A0ABT0VGU2_9LACO|nr:hypothetical protein [Periweissella beninensis]MCT4396674.1 hypothetical protein [Periweissella beninensis]